MNYEHEEVRQVVSDFAVKERRVRKRHLAYTFAALSLGILWIAFSYYQVQTLETEKSKKAEELDRISKEIIAKNEEINEKTRQVDGLNHLLENTRFAGGISKEELERLGKESDKAQVELTKIESPKSERLRRSSIAIQYYSREIEKRYVEDAMLRLSKDYGFKTLPPRKPSEPNTPTNAVWLNREGLTDQDVKLVAYYLTLSGATIKYIGPPTSTCEKFKGLTPAIVVLAEPKVSNEPPLEIDTIRGLSLQAMKSGTKKIDCH